MIAYVDLTTKGSIVKLNFIEEAFLCLMKLPFSAINLCLRYSKENSLLELNLGNLKGSP